MKKNEKGTVNLALLSLVMLSLPPCPVLSKTHFTFPPTPSPAGQPASQRDRQPARLGRFNNYAPSQEFNSKRGFPNKNTKTKERDPDYTTGNKDEDKKEEKAAAAPRDLGGLLWTSGVPPI